MRRCAAVVAAFMLWGSVSAVADSVTVTADRLNMRKDPSVDSRSLGIVTSGEKLTFICEDGGWIYVKNDGQNGYVNASYVLVDQTSLNDDISATVSPVTGTGTASTRVNLRQYPTTQSKIVRVIGQGDGVTITGVCGCWYRMNVDGQTGYAMSEFFTASVNTSQAEADAAAPAATAPVSAVGKTTARVNLRYAPSTMAAAVGVLDAGTQVVVLETEGSWYRVTGDGKTGYISSGYVAFEQQAATSASRSTVKSAATTTTILTGTGIVSAQPSVTGTRVTVANSSTAGASSYAASVSGRTTTRVYLRSAASTSSNAITLIPKGQAVTLTGETGTWYKATYGGRSGYVAKNYVTIDSDATVVSVQDNYEKWTGVAQVIVNMRKAPEGEVITVLNAGAEVTVLGQNGAWYMISYNGSVGYVASSYIAKSGTSTATTQTTTTTQTATVSANGTTMYITGGTVNVRKGPAVTYGVVTTLSTGTQITAYGQTDGWYRMTIGSLSGYVSAKYVTSVKPTAVVTTTTTAASSAAVSTGKVVSSDWWTGEISSVFSRGKVGLVTDVDTSLSFYIKRTGGINHLDCQPLTAADTAIMYRIYGNKWSWDRRAIWVTINNTTYAASMNGMPHGESDSMPDNNFDGCFCIHFTNSRTHTGNRLDAAHQAAVRKALAAGNK